MIRAPDFCTTAARLMDDRGKERDNEGERSMARCVATFNTMTGHELTEEDGWQFMVYLKHSRARGGSFRLDDYEDAVAYQALAAEAAHEAHVVKVCNEAAKAMQDAPIPASLEGLLPETPEVVHVQGTMPVDVGRILPNPYTQTPPMPVAPEESCYDLPKKNYFERPVHPAGRDITKDPAGQYPDNTKDA